MPAWGQETGGDPTRPPSGRPIDVETAPRPFARAVPATGRLAIDGRLDEPAWDAAAPITDFIQSQPRAGYPATERTAVRILYDDRRLYIGAICYESEPNHLTVLSLEQDFPGGSTRDSDIFGVTLDPFLDRQNSFMFLVNPRGAYRDGQSFNDSRQEDFAWRGLVEIKTLVADSGWTVEIAIPWTTLRFDPTKANQVWGLNLLRRIRRKNEDAYWAPVDRKDPVHRMSKAGTLDGIQNIRAGRNLRIKPFALVSDQSGTSFVGSGGAEADAGADAKWGVTSGFTLDATFRTDFSQADVDQERVNLTRFPLFFPEQRDFFVENSGSFHLGDVTERNIRTGSSLREFTLFHTRRIGLTQLGRPVPILGGGRLTGRAAGFELGMLDMQTQRTDSLPAENFAVLRARRNLGGSDVGFMVVNRQETGDGAADAYNRSYGVDANVRLLGHMVVNSYFAGTTESAASGDQTAARVAVGWRDRVWDASAFVKRVGEAFDPGVGFVRRTGIRHAYATVGAHPRPLASLMQETNPYVELSYVTDLNAVLETREASVGLNTQFYDGSTLNLQYSNQFERIERPFTVSGVPIPQADYGFNEVSVSYQSNQGRPVNGSVNLGAGGYYGGTRRSVSGEVQWRAHYRLMFEGSASHNAVKLPLGAFNADVFGGRVRVSYSTRLFGSAFVQYNSQSNQLVTNVRLNWIYAPLSDVFLVYQERRDLTNAVTLDRVVTAKITRLFAF